MESSHLVYCETDPEFQLRLFCTAVARKFHSLLALEETTISINNSSEVLLAFKSPKFRRDRAAEYI